MAAPREMGTQPQPGASPASPPPPQAMHAGQARLQHELKELHRSSCRCCPRRPLALCRRSPQLLAIAVHRGLLLLLLREQGLVVGRCKPEGARRVVFRQRRELRLDHRLGPPARLRLQGACVGWVEVGST